MLYIFKIVYDVAESLGFVNRGSATDDLGTDTDNRGSTIDNSCPTTDSSCPTIGAKSHGLPNYDHLDIMSCFAG